MTHDEFYDLTIEQQRTVIQDAMWDKDVQTLALADCRCCCDEHTSMSCPARIVGDCRGQGSELFDAETWRKQYPHLTDNQFYGIEDL